MIQTHLTTQLAVVAHLPGDLRQGPQQTRQRVQPVDAGHIAHIALHQRLKILPAQAVRRRGSREGFQIATAPTPP